MRRHWRWVLATLIIGVFAGASRLLVHSDWHSSDHLFTRSSPTVVGHLELVDRAGLIVWSLDNSAGKPITEIDYGVVPLGFIQRLPRSGPPRQLLSHEALILSVNFPPQGFAHISVRAQAGAAFDNGVTVSGTGCEQYGCGEVFRLRLLSSPQS